MRVSTWTPLAMGNPFEKELGIPLPQCCSLGSCCKGASPSTPYPKLMQRAREGDDFARGFFSIMVPYATHAEAEKVVPGIVERSLKAAKKLEDFQKEADLVFYSCRYQTPDNKCGVWEDRPQFCRDYPDTPFVVMAPGCAFEPWAKSCKEKYQSVKDEVSKLQSLKQELADLYQQQTQAPLTTAMNELTPGGGISCDTASDLQKQNLPLYTHGNPQPESETTEANPYSSTYTKIDDSILSLNNTDNLSLILSLTRLYVASPLRSIYFYHGGV